MKFSSVRKIWITLFSIVCMLTSSIAFSLPASTINMTLVLTEVQNTHCDMQTMDHSMMVKKANIDYANLMSDCTNASGGMKDCCSDSCTAANCMSTSSLITLNDTDLLNLQSTALLSPTSINSIKSSPSSSLYRPPIL